MTEVKHLTHEDKILLVATVELGRTRVVRPFFPPPKPDSRVIIDSETGEPFVERQDRARTTYTFTSGFRSGKSEDALAAVLRAWIRQNRG